MNAATLQAILLNFLIANIGLVKAWQEAATPGAKVGVVKQLLDAICEQAETLFDTTQTPDSAAAHLKMAKIGDGHLIASVTQLATTLMPLIQTLLPLIIKAAA